MYSSDYQLIRYGGIRRMSPKIKRISCNGRIHLAHFSHGISARVNIPLVTAEVGIIRFEKPSPN